MSDYDELENKLLDIAELADENGMTNCPQKLLEDAAEAIEALEMKCEGYRREALKISTALAIIKADAERFAV